MKRHPEDHVNTSKHVGLLYEIDITVNTGRFIILHDYKHL